jgi:succinoglycan biosynthesis protein ExoA
LRVMQKHRRQMRPRQFVPALFVAALLAALILLPLSYMGKYVAGLVIGLYTIANLSSSFQILRRQNWQLLPLLPIAFATLHSAYGFGFLVGLVRFWNRWGESQSRSNQSGTAVPDVIGPS